MRLRLGLVGAGTVLALLATAQTTASSPTRAWGQNHAVTPIQALDLSASTRPVTKSALPALPFFPTAHARAKSDKPSRSPIRFSGGEVQDYVKAYAILWLPDGFHYTDRSDQNFAKILYQYLQDVGGSKYYNVVTQYKGKNGYIHNNFKAVDYVIDTRPYPTDKNGQPVLNDSTIQQEVLDAINANSWYYGLHEDFFVFTAVGVPNVDVPNACAYHSSFRTDDKTPVVYAHVPSAPVVVECGAHSQHRVYLPHDDIYLDGTLDALAHEQFEMVTDPLGTAWGSDNPLDPQGEVGDKCNKYFGKVGADGANMKLRGNGYALQGLWSNVQYRKSHGKSGCVLGYKKAFH